MAKAKNTVRIRLKAYESRSIDSASKKIVEAAVNHGAKKVVGPVPLPTEKQVVTILRATHKYKDAREQFEIRTHKRLITTKFHICQSPILVVFFLKILCILFIRNKEQGTRSKWSGAGEQLWQYANC